MYVLVHKVTLGEIDRDEERVIGQLVGVNALLVIIVVIVVIIVVVIIVVVVVIVVK